jgi:pSer/pThr/pTyr-binding forkhead associated (FHA) protein
LYLFEPEDEPVESEHPTVCLTAIEHPEGRLVYQGSGAEDSFIIEGESFLVGGRNGQADGKLQSSGVSRNHARITREEHDYYIEDLNSKNGTYLNGDLLPYRQRYHMKPGDHLRFAREEYVFY